MSKELLNAIQQVHVFSLDKTQDNNDCIDAFLDEPGQRKQPRKSLDTVKEDLESQFLKPSTSFSTEWLNKLQGYVCSPQLRSSNNTKFRTGDGRLQ